MNKSVTISALFLFVLLLFFWQIPTPTLQNWIISKYHLDTQQAKKLEESILNQTSWLMIRVFVSIILAILLAFIVIFQKIIIFEAKATYTVFQKQFKTFLKPFQNLSKTEKFASFFVFCLLNAYTLYNLHHKIPHIDEAFSYVHFASKGILVSAL